MQFIPVYGMDSEIPEVMSIVFDPIGTLHTPFKTTEHIENVDMLDETPLLDIKPYIPAFDCHETEKTGWVETKTGNMYRTTS